MTRKDEISEALAEAIRHPGIGYGGASERPLELYLSLSSKYDREIYKECLVDLLNSDGAQFREGAAEVVLGALLRIGGFPEIQHLEEFSSLDFPEIYEKTLSVLSDKKLDYAFKIVFLANLQEVALKTSGGSAFFRLIKKILLDTNVENSTIIQYAFSKSMD